jgi:hypothetical protein
MEKTKLSLDNFLEEEKSASSDLLVIIESDEQNKNNVTISPWNKNGCNCSGKFSIVKSLVESIEKTKDTHYCCGGIHTVVKVNFAKGASIEIGDLLEQMASNSNKPGTNLMHHTSQPFNWSDVNPDIIDNNIPFLEPYGSIRQGFERCRKQQLFEKCSGGFRVYEIFVDILTNKLCGPKVLVADYCNRRFQDRNGQSGSYNYYNSGNDIG